MRTGARTSTRGWRGIRISSSRLCWHTGPAREAHGDGARGHGDGEHGGAAERRSDGQQRRECGGLRSRRRLEVVVMTLTLDLD